MLLKNLHHSNEKPLIRVGSLIGYLLLLLAPCQLAYGQCTNADFSDGNFNGWTGTYGNSYDSSGCLYSNPYQFSGYLLGPLNDPDNDQNNEYCQVISNTAGGYDPYLSSLGINIPMVCPTPAGFTYSGRIGNLWPKYGEALLGTYTPDAESITYTFTVTAANSAFTYYYFPILNVGSGHTEAEQPYFHIFMTASGTDTIACAALNVDATNAANIGFSTIDDGIFDNDFGTIYYKTWTPVYIPLFNYIGQTVAITFVTRSCNPNACAGTHFAVAYIDAQCGPIALSVVPNGTCTGVHGYTLTAPAGLATYSWTGPGITTATGQSYNATLSGHYVCTMTTQGASPCTFTLDTTVTVTTPTHYTPAFSSDTVCLGTPTTFTDHSTSIPAGQVNTWAWSFYNNATTNSIVQDPTYTFSVAGSLPVKLTLGSAPCTVDTVINVVVYPKSNAGPDQALSCVVLPGGTATMGATGTGTWTPQTGNPGTATITNTNLATTTITGFSAAGKYNFIWTNANGCTDTAAVVVTAKPNAGPDQNVLCAPIPGGGSATMAATGTGTWAPRAGNPGTAVITNTIDSTTTITTFSAAGSYYFVWTNASGCTDTAEVTVTSHPNAGPFQTVSCAALPGGSATMAASGTGVWSTLSSNPGSSVITYPDSANTTIAGYSAPGTYKYVWTLGSCSDTTGVFVSAKPNAGPDQSVLCATLPGGSATMAATGQGTWSAQPGNPGTATITTPTDSITTITGFTSAGRYYFIWTNDSLCTDTAAVIVTAHPNAGPDQLVSCAELPGGAATMAATDTGTWTPMTGNPGTATITNPDSANTTITTFGLSGTYYFIWTAAGCADTAKVTVTAKPTAGPDQAVNCIFLPGGAATMAATGLGTWTTQTGNPGNAIITNPTDSTTTITGFTAAGTYYFIWTNDSLCTDTAAIVVTTHPNAGPDQTVTCAVLPGGTATMAASGIGTWTPETGNPGTAVITAPTDSFTTITTFGAPGVYSFIWTNAAGCSDTATVTVTQQPVISLPNAAYCLGGSAILTPVVTPAGGTYLWSTGQTTPAITSDTAVTSYISVAYTVGTCTADTTDTVTIYPQPTATISTIPSICTANNGIAIADPAAGTPGYTYSWSGPSGPLGTGDTISSLSPNTYQVTVSDSHSCTATASGTVGLQTPAITIAETQHDLKCFNDGSGDIYLSVTDTARTSAGYNLTYLWSGVASGGQDLLGVQAGPYSVTVVDQFGCTGSGSYTLTQPTALAATDSFTSPQCFGYADGNASVVNPTGGSGSYHYLWSTAPAQTTQQATGLVAGTYTVSMTDDSACLYTLTVTLTDPLAITFGTPVPTMPLCYGDSNGTVQVSPQNGIGTYTFAWSYDSETTNPAINLPAGTYTVTATDHNGCSATDTIPLAQPSQVYVSLAAVNVKCFGYADGSATATATGGTPPYTYLWDGQQTTATISGLPIGTYAVTASDDNGCTAAADTTLVQPPHISETVSALRTSCPNSDDGVIIVSASGGTGTFTYAVDTNGMNIVSGITADTITGFPYGPYTVVATDQNGCPDSANVTVPQAPYNVYTDTAISTTCYGVQYKDGIVHVQGYQVANGPFQYSIDGGTLQYTPDFFDLSAGTHTILAQDNYGCDTTFTIVVPEPPAATLQILPGDTTIAPGDTVQLSTVFTGYSVDSIKGYMWSPANGLSCIDCPAPVASPYGYQNTYTLVVTYNQGCVDTAAVQINTSGIPPVYIPNAFTPNGDGTNDIWYVYGSGIKDFQATIYDRWGEKVFESTDQSQGWDGRYRGQLEPPGVYVYLVVMVYLDGQQVTKQGSVSLIR